MRRTFTEDGPLYNAVIKSIDKENFFGVVRYVEYENEEEQNIDDLLPYENLKWGKTKKLLTK